MSLRFTQWFPAGYRLINGLTLTNWFNQPKVSVDTAITATANGGQANAYKIKAAINRITVCATNGDSVQLPNSQSGGSNASGGVYGSSLVGTIIEISNDGVANLAIFPSAAVVNGVGDQIDAAGLNTSVTLTTGHRALFFYNDAGVITSLAGTKSS